MKASMLVSRDHTLNIQEVTWNHLTCGSSHDRWFEPSQTVRIIKKAVKNPLVKIRKALPTEAQHANLWHHGFLGAEAGIRKVDHYLDWWVWFKRASHLVGSKMMILDDFSILVVVSAFIFPFHKPHEGFWIASLLAGLGFSLPRLASGRSRKTSISEEVAEYVGEPKCLVKS